MTQSTPGPRRKDGRTARKGTPGGTGRKVGPPPDVADMDQILAGVNYDREIKIVPPTWAARDRIAEINFTSGNLTNTQGVTRSDLERLAAEITRWQAENGTGND
jgi:hypothetical protein